MYVIIYLKEYFKFKARQIPYGILHFFISYSSEPEQFYTSKYRNIKNNDESRVQLL